MPSQTAAGTTLAISAAAPATQDEAGYAALSYTEIGEIEKIGTIGASIETINFQPLKGATQKHKGPVNYGSLQPSMAVDSADAGQIMLRAASDPEDNALYAYEVTLPDGAKRYFQGRCFGYPEQIDGANTILMANPTIEINTKVVIVDA